MDLLLSIIYDISKLDRELFILIHSKWSSPKLDQVFKLLRDALVWIPLYIFILYWIIRYNKKYAWQFILFTLVCFAVTDYTSASILKPFFHRLRPCFDTSLNDYLRVIITCGGKYGMPSSHAANHFGLAAFWFFSITYMSNRKWYWLWIWSAIICYAQVYVGKHYPGDVFAGALLGTLVGFILALIFRKWLLAGPSQSYLPSRDVHTQ